MKNSLADLNRTKEDDGGNQGNKRWNNREDPV